MHMFLKATLFSLMVMGVAHSADRAETLLKNPTRDRWLMRAWAVGLPMASCYVLKGSRYERIVTDRLTTGLFSTFSVSDAFDRKMNRYECRLEDVHSLNAEVATLHAEMAKEPDNVRRDVHWRKIESVESLKERQFEQIKSEVVGIERLKKVALFSTILAVPLSLALIYRSKTPKVAA